MARLAQVGSWNTHNAVIRGVMDVLLALAVFDAGVELLQHAPDPEAVASRSNYSNCHHV